MDFVAIDFETANEKRSSACSIGIVVVRKGKVEEKRHFLIKPYELYFNPINVSIHGIRERDIINQPQFNQLWPEIKSYFSNTTLVAHNASFDISVLRGVLDSYKISYPEIHYSCTRIISKKVWPNHASYSLDTIAKSLGINFKHHDALEDALACAKIAMEACNLTGVSCLQELAEIHNLQMGHLFQEGYKPFSNKKQKVKAQKIVVQTEDFGGTMIG